VKSTFTDEVDCGVRSVKGHVDSHIVIAIQDWSTANSRPEMLFFAPEASRSIGTGAICLVIRREAACLLEVFEDSIFRLIPTYDTHVIGIDAVIDFVRLAKDCATSVGQ